MAVDPVLVSRIRNRIVGEMHLGHLRGGDRLPGVREMAREMEADHRAVSNAYRALHAEGLVEVRGRAGAYVARQERLGGELPGETAAWLAGVLSEARRRRIGIPDFPELVRSYTGRVRLRCACVESNQDSSGAICMELAEEFGLEPSPVAADAVPAARGRKRLDPAGFPGALREADLVVTTAFHAQAVQPAAEALGKAFVMVTVNPEMAGIIQRRLRAGPLTLIVVDPAYAERFREVYGHAGAADRLRVVRADDRIALARLDRSQPVLATRAARRALPDLDLPLLLPRYPSISPESTRDLAELIIRLNLERGG
ncbi:MAG TPA: GntR family transcriptional regulator [Longimicrobium sp.]|nr:GntR family transcriptional regulator [Longimicrobium sp.]